MIYMGIDPGKKGGISIQQTSEDNVVRLINIIPMPAVESDISEVIYSFRNTTIQKYYGLYGGGKASYSEVDECKAIIESVHAFPGQGVTSMFTFGQGYGFLRGCLVSLGIPFIEITPQKWQSAFGLKKQKGETQPDYKKRIYQKAKNMFPNSSVALQTADSLLLAEYLRRINVRNT